MAKKRYDYFAEETPVNSDMEVFDCNNTPLSPWDSIIAIKWLKVKWGTDIKQWEKFTNISFTDDPTHVQVRTKKNGKMMLRTEFFKKG